MEITTNSSIYTTVSTSQTTSNTNTQNTSNSFNALVNSQNQETTTTTVRTPKIVEFLDARNGFSSLSPTDEKIFKDILSDNKLTKEEANSLSYEQVERIRDLISPAKLTKEEMYLMPIVQSGVDLIATQITGNRQFNEAYYNTLKELDDKDASILRNEVENNLGQLFTGKELRATFQYKDCYLVNPWEYQNIDTDFSKFIKDVKSHHEVIIANHKGNDEIKKQFQDVVDVYSILEKSYNQVLNKTKYP